MLNMSTEQPIREITRKEYDTLVAGQQAFFDDKECDVPDALQG
jgi:hypothetical protein